MWCAFAQVLRARCAATTLGFPSVLHINGEGAINVPDVKAEFAADGTRVHIRPLVNTAATSNGEEPFIAIACMSLSHRQNVRGAM